MKNTTDLRKFLLAQMQGIADGEIENDTAKGVCNTAQQVYNTLNIELKVAAATAKYGDDLQVKALSFDD
jgi:hypothetical protein